MKTSAIIRIVLYSLVVILLLGILLVGLGMDALSFINPFDSDEHVSGGITATAGSVDGATVRDLQIEWAAGSITIQPGDVDTIIFSETETEDEKDQMVWKQSGDKLVIQFSERNTYWGISLGTTADHPKDLVITVPRDWNCDELDLDAAAATVEIRDMTIESVDFDGASGKCTFDNCQVNDMDLDGASCDILFSGTLNELDCDGASASVTAVLYNQPRHMELDMASGDLDLTLPPDTGFRVSMDGLSSDFSSDFETTREGDAYVCGDGSCRINVSGLSTDITIRKGE